MKLLFIISCILGARLCCCDLIICNNFITCSTCIGHAEAVCVWCAAQNHTGYRCQSESFHDTNKNWCKGSVYNDKTSEINITEGKDLSDGTDGSKKIQLTPQYATIKSRPGIPVTIKMSHKPAKDYPLDIYFLMDYSYTMRTYKAALEQQAAKIRSAISDMTNNVRFGIGSFVEKPGFPYTESSIQFSYSFRNHLTLTENMTLFKQIVQEPRVATGSVLLGNFDDPEACLDALMQAMVCNEVGWRKDARRIIVLSTDAGYHSAGDGKIIGAIKPNDMKCHLKDHYLISSLYDYPSVSQINKVASEENIKIIFATTKKVEDFYINLSKEIQQSTYVEFNLGTDISHMILTEYQSLIRNVQMDYEIPPHIHLTLNPTCNEDSKCILPYKGSVQIEATFKIKYCPTKNESNIVKIGPLGLNERFFVEIDAKCNCNCKELGLVEENSTMCHEAGTYQCGICTCNPGRYGSTCRCNGTSSDTEDDYKCKLNVNETIFCSGRGTCRCGKCEDCLSGFSGDFCQYNDEGCKRVKGELCAGNGLCMFGRCQCKEGYSGDDCRCHRQKCVAPQSSEICSGNGECDCDECKCKGGKYTGVYCDNCDECAAKRCKELENYVFCCYTNNRTVCNEQYGQRSDTEVFIVNKTDIDSTAYVTAVKCEKTFENGSILFFKYFYEKPENNLVLVIQKDLEQPPELNIWVPVGSAIGVVLLIGILTVIIWKILIDIHDAKEYKKFQEESAAAGFDVSNNPLYQPPTVNFNNPAFMK